LDIGVLGFFGIVSHKEHPPEVWSVPPVTPCIWVAGCWVRFPNDAACASDNYGHSFTALLGIFLWGVLIFGKRLHEKKLNPVI